MPLKVVIVDKGRKAFENLLKKLQSSLEIDVGIVGPNADSPHPSAEGLTISELGAVHEFGLGVPERPWLRGWFDKNRSELSRKVRAAGKGAYLQRSKKLKAEGKVLGRAMAEDLKRSMQSVPPRLHPTTIERKGHARTLVASKVLHDAVTFKAKVKKGLF